MMILIKKPTLQKHPAEFGKKKQTISCWIWSALCFIRKQLKNTVGYFIYTLWNTQALPPIM